MWCRLLEDSNIGLPVSPGATDIFGDVIKTGVNPNSKFNGKTIFEYLLNRFMLGNASEKKLLEMSGILLAAGSDPNQHTSFWDGASPLHIAARAGAQKLVEQLLSYGADPKKTDGLGRTYRDYIPRNFNALPVMNTSFPSPPMIVVSGWDA
jgi:ankyrin repeat protein